VQGGGSFMDTLPDPMRPTLFEIGFVVVVVVLLYFFLKSMLFAPLGRLMDDRETDIAAGASLKLEVSKTIEARQADYAEKVRELRSKAFEHRKALALGASEEKNRVVDDARQRALAMRKEAMDKLVSQRETARAELVAQVDALADTVAQHLLKQV
jgi:F-type H+-transporting ATPase subunit b